METDRTIQNIQNLLSTYTAVQFAEGSLSDKTDQYLYDNYASSNEEPLEVVKNKAYVEYLEKYSDNVTALTGFIKMGRVFVLDKRDRLIYFVAGERKDHGTVRLIVHYNPYNIDCFEMSTQAKRLFDNSDPDRFELSLDEERLVNELHQINPQ